MFRVAADGDRRCIAFPARWFLLLLTVAGCTVVLGTPSAGAAEPPQIISSRVEGVSATAVTLRVTLNPNGLSTTYRFEYLAEAAYQANLGTMPLGDGFQGAAVVPLAGASAGAGMAPVTGTQHLMGLAPATSYRYRVVASSSGGTTFGLPRPFTTEEPTNAFRLLDGRGWEMVSPIDKNGGAIQGPGQSHGGGVFQAATGGGALTYSSRDSFGEGAQGAPSASQYLAGRSPGGWATQNLTTPLLSGSYGDRPEGVPYQLFSSNLALALLSNGERCRGGSSGECPVANPALPGTNAPAGFRNFYLRASDGSFKALLGPEDLVDTELGPQQFDLTFVAASPDLDAVLLSSCAKLTPNAIEVASASGCDPAAQNLYRWSGGELRLVNVLPGDTQGTPGAAVAAQGGAVPSSPRVYWAEGGTLYLWEDGQTKLLDESAGGSFQTASADGRFAFFVTASGHLDCFDAVSGVSADLTPSGGVLGVLGAAADGSRAYYLTAAGLFLWSTGASTEIAGTADAGNYPPSTGTARVSADGAHLVFISSAELTDYESGGFSEVYLFGPPPGGGKAELSCVSCSPTGTFPQGDAVVPGAIANGSGAAATNVYKPRSLSSDGHRVFFDSSDALVTQDTNQRPDVYEWEASGAGDCRRPHGCIGLISSGRSSNPSTFLDASSDGSDVFFLTDSSLYGPDPGSFDIYDAREGGGFAPPPNQIPCDGDACQSLPEAPEDPSPGTLVPNSGNPSLRVSKPKSGKRHKKHRHRRKAHQGRPGRK